MGGKKKTKQQIEAEKAAAEEEKRIQEEIERKQAEAEAERKRIEEEKRAAEEKKRKEEEEKRLSEQAPFVQERDASMISKRKLAAESRIKPLDDKFLMCDPLPDPDDEKDLTTFITLWKESKDKTMKEAADNCQTAENVIKAINIQLSEALAQYDYAKIAWCKEYIKILREISIEKYEHISAEILSYVENYTKYTDAEIKELKENAGGRKIDYNQRAEFEILGSTPDIQFGIWANVQQKSQHFRKIALGNYSSGLPRQNASMNLIVRQIWTSFDYISGPENMKKSDDIVVGGVGHFRMFAYPKPMKMMMKWQMRQVESVQNQLVCIPYPDPTSQVSVDPIPAIYTLPEYVFTTENDDIKIGVWDEEQQQWSSDFIEELTLDRQKREMEFQTRKFAPVAYLQKKCTDFPYDAWYIRSTADQVALLTIKTKRIEVNIEIHPLFVKLVKMEQPQIQHLINQEMHPGILLMELSKCGIHMLPEDDDAARAGIHLKDKNAEERAILDIAQTLKIFAFQSLKWNQEASQENIVCRLRENPDNDITFLEDDESDWKSIMWWSNKVSYIKARNCDKAFNGEISTGQVTHSLLSLATEGVQSQEAFERSQQYHDIDFIDNVQRTLRLLRLFAFTTSEFDKRTIAEQEDTTAQVQKKIVPKIQK